MVGNVGGQSQRTFKKPKKRAFGKKREAEEAEEDILAVLESRSDAQGSGLGTREQKQKQLEQER